MHARDWNTFSSQTHMSVERNSLLRALKKLLTRCDERGKFCAENILLNWCLSGLPRSPLAQHSFCAVLQ
jgi:hypothetical protein